MKPAHVGVVALFLLFIAGYIALLEWLRSDPHEHRKDGVTSPKPAMW